MSGFNPLCGANKLKRSGGAGYTEKGKTLLTFDGDVSDKYVEDVLGVKVSDATTDWSNVGIVEMTSGDGVNSLTSGFTVETTEFYDLLCSDGFPLAYSLPNDVEGTPKGTYVYYDGTYYVSRVATAETVHTIDPKYLPSGGGGGGLPYVELETPIMLNDDGTGEGALSAEESAKLTEAFATSLPVVVKISFNSMLDVTLVFNAMSLQGNSGLIGFVMIPGMISAFVGLMYDDRGWIYEIESMA